jgi:hypothetical protein
MPHRPNVSGEDEVCWLDLLCIRSARSWLALESRGLSLRARSPSGEKALGPMADALSSITGALVERLPSTEVWSQATETWESARLGEDLEIVIGMKLTPEEMVARLPMSSAQIVRLQVNGDHERPDWIRIYLVITMLNEGAQSAVRDWKVAATLPSGRRYMGERELSRQPDGLDGAGANLFLDESVIPLGGRRTGWLLIQFPKDRLDGLTTETESQITNVVVEFTDVRGTSTPPNNRICDHSASHSVMTLVGMPQWAGLLPATLSRSPRPRIHWYVDKETGHEAKPFH